jgi:hypothetical protein
MSTVGDRLADAAVVHLQQPEAVEKLNCGLGFEVLNSWSLAARQRNPKVRVPSQQPRTFFFCVGAFFTNFLP